MKLFPSLAAVSLFVASSRLAQAGERFVVVPINAITFDDPAPSGAVDDSWQWRTRGSVLYEPYVVLDTPGDAFFEYETQNLWTSWPQSPRRLVLRVDDEHAKLSGRWFAADRKPGAFVARRFHVEVATDEPEARNDFYSAMEEHYTRLRDAGLPGAAWFRHQVAVARAARGATDHAPSADSGLLPWTATSHDFGDTLDLFTGGRALAENLDIDRALSGTKDEPESTELASIEGVQTRAMDWKTLVKDLKPELDPLAKLIPADQHAVFFPSFSAMVAVLDEIDRSGSPLVEFLDAHGEDQLTKSRYQTQLCLPLSSLARVLGPAVVSSVAVTGSDPLFPSGTDIALLFDCKQPLALETLLAARHAEARNAGAGVVQGSAGSLKFTGVRSDDRRVCSYVARSGDTVIVTNSTAQLEQLAAAIEQRVPALASADEYVWFRDRYKRGDANESALMVLTDATIRRWASPRSRIADSRRVRAAAAMAELHARQVAAFAAGSLPTGISAADPSLPISADFTWTPRGVRSPRWGSLEFLTPVAELAIERVTPSEKQAYDNFRRGFESRWRNVFDPIALRLTVSDARLDADLTVMPLVVASEYRELRDLTLDATLAPTAGDPHADTLVHLALAFGKRSEIGRIFAAGAGGFAQQLGADPLGWIGNGIAIYLDRDSFWDELRAAPEIGDFMEENVHRLPLAIHIEVKEPLKLAAFLTALHALADNSAPGMTMWENRTWHEQPYVRIGSQDLGISVEELALYYAPMGDGLVLSLREDIVQRAIDRKIARKAGQIDAASLPAWLGSSVALRVDRAGFETLADVFSGATDNPMQIAAWSTLPILNEWHRRFPNEDPVALHERLFGVRLISPGGGTFSWNDATQAMESSDYGSPAAPKSGPRRPAELDRYSGGEFGLSFEGEGLRARLQLLRPTSAAPTQR